MAVAAISLSISPQAVFAVKVTTEHGVCVFVLWFLFWFLLMNHLPPLLCESVRSRWRFELQGFISGLLATATSVAGEHGGSAGASELSTQPPSNSSYDVAPSK